MNNKFNVLDNGLFIKISKTYDNNKLWNIVFQYENEIVGLLGQMGGKTTATPVLV